MKVGNYIRSKDGKINKIIQAEYEAPCNAKHQFYYLIDNLEEIWYPENEITKSSPNILDLIQKGDYVNGEKITRIIPEDICGDEILDYQHIFIGDKEIYKEDIKSILTKEQFESMEYKIESEVN